MQIKFNYYIPRKYFNKKENAWSFSKPSGKDVMQIGTIEDIQKFVKPTFVKEECPLIQAFTCGYRMTKSTLNFDYWNNVTFTDIDTKNYFKDKNISIDINKLHEHIHRQAIIDYPNNYVCSYVTASGLGFRIIWYWDCDKSKDNFDKCAMLTDEYARNIFYSFGDAFKEMIDYDGVLDKCSKSSLQCMYLWQSPLFNDYTKISTFGEINKDDFDKVSDTVENIKKSYTQIVDNTASYEITKVDIKGMFRTKHMGRFKDYTTLKRLTPNKTECDNIWRELCKHFEEYVDSEGKHHTYDTFIKEFNYDQIDENTANISRLSKYGIYVDDKKIYHHLSDNQYLGDILDKLLEETPIGVSIWQAPTGSGKNTCWINYNNRILATERDKHKPILIVEPLNSINMTKYEKDENIEVFIKSKRFPEKIEGYKMCATNYNKLLRKDIDGNWVVREDAEQFLSQFELIVIDESHILTKDNFRSDIIVKFINTIKQVSSKIKIILQTATPMAEKELFYNLVQRHFIITKKSNKTINLNFLRYDNRNGGNFSITDLILKVRQNAEQGILTYIYYNNAALNTLKKFRELYGNPDKTAIFHKENDDDISMQRIKEYHVMDSKNYKGDDMIDEYKYDVLLSSVYFGVGNDLNDEQDACVIIVGNNTWQEDIQAIGRFRNSKHIDVSIILRTFEYNEFNNTKGYMPKIKQEIEDKYRNNREKFKDRTIREYSVIINKKAWRMTCEEDARPIAVMEAYDKYCSLYEVKIKNLSDPYYGINVNPDFEQFLDAEEVDETKLEEFNDKCKSVIKQEKINMLNEIYNYDIINKYPTLIEFKSFVRQLINNGVVIKFGVSFCVEAKNQKMLKCFCKYFRKLKARTLDYAELLALLFFVEQDNSNEYQKGISYKLTKRRYNSIIAYMMFETLLNKNADKLPGRMLSTSYYTDFYADCKLFDAMPDEMIDMFYSTNSVKENVTLDNAAIIEFFDESGQNVDLDLNDVRIHSTRDIMKQCKQNKAYESENNAQFDRIVKYCLNICNAAKIENGKKGGKSGVKKCVILKAMPTKTLSKYGLNVGDEYESGDELADKTGVKKCTITTWRKKKWIE